MRHPKLPAEPAAAPVDPVDQRAARRVERDLVQRMMAGDEAAMEAFADRYFSSLYRFTRARVRGDGELARDLVQTTVCKALANLRSFRGDSPLLTWLCACARNEIGMHYRRRARFTELPVDDDNPVLAVPLVSTGDSPERSVQRKETAQLVLRSLQALAPRYAQVLEWKYFDQTPVAEIATRLGLSPKAAESLLTRARVAFRAGFDRLQRPPAGGTGEPPGG